MSYLDNLSNVSNTDFILTEEASDYLCQVYDECDTYMQKQYHRKFVNASSILAMINDLHHMYYVKPICIPMYDKRIIEMIRHHKTIGDIYKYAYHQVSYVRSEDDLQYFNCTYPTETLRESVIALALLSLEENTTAKLTSVLIPHKIMELFLALTAKYQKEMHAVDILSGNKISNALDCMVEYLIDIHDIFRFVRVYKTNKSFDKKIRKRVHEALSEYRSDVSDVVADAIMIFAKHNHLDDIPEELSGQDIYNYMETEQIRQVMNSGYNKTLHRADNVTIHGSDIGIEKSFHIRVGNIVPRINNPACSIKTQKHLRYIFEDIKEHIGHELEMSIYDVMCEIADQSEKTANCYGAVYSVIPKTPSIYMYDLEMGKYPKYKLAEAAIPVTPINTRLKYTSRRMNDYHNRHIVRNGNVYGDDGTTVSWSTGFRCCPSDYVAVDPHEVYIDGTSYKFTNDALSDREPMPIGFSYPKDHKLTVRDFEQTSGLQSISYRPLDEFGEPDRSNWEPRRNNWNQ